MKVFSLILSALISGGAALSVRADALLQNFDTWPRTTPITTNWQGWSIGSDNGVFPVITNIIARSSPNCIRFVNASANAYLQFPALTNGAGILTFYCRSAPATNIVLQSSSNGLDWTFMSKRTTTSTALFASYSFALNQFGSNSYRIVVPGGAGITSLFIDDVSLTEPTNGVVEFFSLTVTAVNGTVVKAPEAATYAKWSSVSLAATGNPGYHFTGWSRGASGTNNPVSVVIESNTAVTANFMPNLIPVLPDRTSLSIPEGGSTNFHVRLGDAPLSNVVLRVNRVSGDSDITVAGGASLNFTTNNWADFQTVTLAAANDADNVSGLAVLTCSGAGLITATVQVSEVDAQAPPKPAGSGTVEDPYAISSMGHFDWLGGNCMGSFATAVYSLQNDLDASETTNWYAKAGFRPIGTAESPFKGRFFGNGHTISGLMVNRSTNAYTGLFGYVSETNCEISDLSLVDCRVRGGDNVGALVGFMLTGRVTRCFSSGYVAGLSSVGGLVGYTRYVTYTECGSTASVTGSVNHIGGLVGYAWGVTLDDCEVAGSVTGGSFAGGLAGSVLFGCTERDCRAGGNVAGSNYVGGLVGYLIFGGTITNCVSTGPVAGVKDVGGLVGYATSGSLGASHSSGPVSGDSMVGGLIGEASASSLNTCYSFGAVSGTDSVGGLAGSFDGGTAGVCYATGPVLGGKRVGGLVGQGTSVSIRDCYAAGAVSGDDGVGGLIGSNRLGSIADCYAAGPVQGMAHVGGLIGTNSAGVATRAYWDRETTGCDASSGGTGLSSDGMTATDTFDGWDFDSTWGLEGGYPFLKAFATFTLVYAADGQGSFEGGSNQLVNARSTGAPCTAVPLAGSSFVAWSDGLLTPRRIDRVVASNMAATALFEVHDVLVLADQSSVSVPEGGTESFRIKLSAQPAGDTPIAVGRTAGDGDIGVSGDGTVTFSTTDWGDYQAVTLSAAEDDTDQVNGTATITCWAPGVSNVTIEAAEVDDDYALTVLSPDGTVSRDPDAALYDSGTTVTLAALGNDGYHFVNWSGDATGVTNPVTLVLDADKAVTAVFALNVITVLTDRAFVTVPEGGSADFQVRLSAQPTGETVVAVSRLAGDADLAVSANSNLSFSAANWTAGQTVTVSAEEDGDDNQDGSATLVCSSDGVSNAFVIASEADDDYALTVTALNGTVVLDPELPYYEPGTVVALRALPAPSWFFNGFSGDLAGTNNPVSLTMDGDKTVAASFVPKAPVVLPPARIGMKGFTARLQWVEGGAPEGELSVILDGPGFPEYVPGYRNRYVHNVTECQVTNMLADRTYWYRIRRVTPDGLRSGWSADMKVRTGSGRPVFKRLLAGGAASRDVSQQFALSNLVSGVGTVAVKSSDPDAVMAELSEDTLTLHYLWKTSSTAMVTLTLTQPGTGFKVTYGAGLDRVKGSVSVIGRSALTNAGVHAAQEVTLENRTGRTLFGLRVRALGLDKPGWLVNRTGLDPVSRAPIRELPCVLPAGSQTVVRLVYNTAYKKQSRTRPVIYGAWAIVPPVVDTPPDGEERAIGRQEPYDGLCLLGLAANANRLYAVYWSDDGGDTWTLELPLVRATANYLMWLDLDEAAPANRLYRVVDAGM